MSSDFTVHPETRSGDPFVIFGAVEVEECPACYSGGIFAGHMVHDEQSGEEVDNLDLFGAAVASGAPR